MDCTERRDLILLYAAGALDAGECGGLREHLATGCPQCAGYLAEAEATLATLPLGQDLKAPPAGLKQKILSRARAEAARPLAAPMRIGNWDWDRIVLPAAIAAVLAVAITLLVVKQLVPTHSADDVKTIADLQGRVQLTTGELQLMSGQLQTTSNKLQASSAQLQTTQNQLQTVETQLQDARNSLANMKYAELTGPAQPGAVGHVFLDTKMKNWYFFTCGMKPAPDGKTYELWVINNGQKIPAGTFNVKPDGGRATLLGTIPPLSGAGVTLAVTDEPATGEHKVPTGSLQIKGDVE